MNNTDAAHAARRVAQAVAIAAVWYYIVLPCVEFAARFVA